MRFVPVRSIDNQAVLMHHKVREMLVAQRTQLINALRGHLAEIGIISAQGPATARALAALVAERHDMIPERVRSALMPLVRQLSALDEETASSDPGDLQGLPAARRLMSVPGIGPITASAIVASVQDVFAFSGAREFAAFLGLTPRQNSSGARSDWVASRRWATVICASCSSSARMGAPPSQEAQRRVAYLGRPADGNKALQAGRRSHRQQACPHRLRSPARRNAVRRRRSLIHHRIPQRSLRITIEGAHDVM